ncbi:TPA: hypothetical protein ACSTL5_000949 [Serratia fonticola]
MKIISNKILIDNLSYASSECMGEIINDINDAISKVTWPLGNTNFTINPKEKGNGVKPIKNECMAHLQSMGWELEKRLSISSVTRPGPVDAMLEFNNGMSFALEWETGNISSSHRALNKICLGMLSNILIGGILVLPSKAMYRFLTDRVGNYDELSPYFPVWESLNVREGFLAVIQVEHDDISLEADLIPKGTDGWANFQVV